MYTTACDAGRNANFLDAGARDRLLADSEHLGPWLILGRALRQGHRVVQLDAVPIRGSPTVKVTALAAPSGRTICSSGCPHERKDLVSEGYVHILPVAPCVIAAKWSAIGETEDDLRYSRTDVFEPTGSTSLWTSGQSTRQQPQTRVPSERTRSASLVKEQPSL